MDKKTVFFISIFVICMLLTVSCRTQPVPETAASPSPVETETPAPTPKPTQPIQELHVSFVEPTPVPTPSAEPEATSEPAPAVPVPVKVIRQDLSRNCTFRSSQKNVSVGTLADDKLATSVILSDKASMTYSWTEEVPASVLYLFSYVVPDAFRISQWDGSDGLLLDEELIPSRMCLQLPLQDGCRKVTVQCLGRCKINAFQIFGPGDAFPEEVVWWRDDEADHCDLMLFSTHFDDEILMMGGVLPIYAGEQKRDCRVVYMKGKDKVRKLEAIQGLWEMGVRREAIYLSCSSKSLQAALDNDAAGVFAGDDLQKLVYLLRRYRPLVVVTHDVNGEYGHESHVKTSALVRRAVELASDAAYDPDTASEYGVWQVQKEYIHLWKENPLVLDVQVPLENMDGRTAFEVAARAFTYHKTQQKWSISSTHRQYPIGSYGLYFTAVGPDSGLNDMFENIDMH